MMALIASGDSSQQWYKQGGIVGVRIKAIGLTNTGNLFRTHTCSLCMILYINPFWDQYPLEISKPVHAQVSHIAWYGLGIWLSW